MRRRNIRNERHKTQEEKPAPKPGIQIDGWEEAVAENFACSVMEQGVRTIEITTDPPTRTLLMIPWLAERFPCFTYKIIQEDGVPHFECRWDESRRGAA